MLAQQRIQTLQKESCNEVVLHIKSDMHRSKTEISHESMRGACLTQQQKWTFFLSNFPKQHTLKAHAVHAVECDAGETKALADQIEVDETIKQIKAFQVLGDKQQACQHHRLTRFSICL